MGSPSVKLPSISWHVKMGLENHFVTITQLRVRIKSIWHSVT